MWIRRCPFVVVMLLWLGLAAQARGETFLVIVEEFCDGEAAESPLASQEGLMSAMFDLGHITFETGPYRPEMDWDSLEFAEPLRLAREGRGRYLAAARVFAEPHPSERSGAPGAVEVTVRASYLLFDAESSRLLGRGELNGSSSDGERELSYEELLFATGERLARALAALCPSDDLP